MGTTPLYLDVPYEDRELAKEAGAWWDPIRKRWFIPPGRPVNHHLLDDTWFRIEPCPSDQGVPVRVLSLTLDCWRCHRPTRAIVGLEPDRDDGFATADSGFNLKLACVLLGAPLPACVGEVKLRGSMTAGHSYLSTSASLDTHDLVKRAGNFLPRAQRIADSGDTAGTRSPCPILN